MTQADSVHSTPPSRTPIDTNRRNFIAQVVAVTAAGGALGMTLPLPVAAEPPAAAPVLPINPALRSAVAALKAASVDVKAAIATHDAAWNALLAAEEAYRDAAAAVANIRVANHGELVFKAAAAALYDGLGHAYPKVCAVSYSVAQELILDSEEYAAQLAKAGRAA